MNQPNDNQINHAPDHVGPLGHGTRRLSEATDTEGHARVSVDDDTAADTATDETAADDTEGHRRITIGRDAATEDDTEGHRRLP